jgi:hypothetical protein
MKFSLFTKTAVYKRFVQKQVQKFKYTKEKMKKGKGKYTYLHVAINPGCQETIVLPRGLENNSVEFDDIIHAIKGSLPISKTRTLLLNHEIATVHGSLTSVQ